MKLWTLEQKCNLVTPMWVSAGANFERHDPALYRATRDNDLYNDQDSAVYRDDFKDEIQRRNKQHPLILESRWIPMRCVV
jgi:hypothetical protein